MSTDKDVKSLEPHLAELGLLGTGRGILAEIDPSDLSIETEAARFVSSGRGTPRAADMGGGYDPYNQTHSRKNPAAMPKPSQVKR
jgi:hypothetical protein